ncbi:hypothetical protein [Brucella anthropi]|uniref:hypothetical protein n=1 Tax=Brucella anthropi TaxID=529 RepID=UPI0021582271|nr:hypothetical protein [Brucella anthropi]MCR8493699.1 hypothetical protein [Brucella anthropi]
MHTYNVGNYIREEYFHELVIGNNGAILVYCAKAMIKNKASKFSGRWHLYAFNVDENSWQPFVKSKLENKRIVNREFVTSDGLINSLLRYNYPVVGIPSERNSGCEIHKNGDIFFRPQCVFV